MSDFVWAKRRELHTSPEIAWSRCDGCEELTCAPPKPQLERIGRGEWGYYCSALARHLTKREIYEMTMDECPKGRELKRRRTR